MYACFMFWMIQNNQSICLPDVDDWVVFVVWDLNKTAIRAAAIAVPTRRAASKEAIKHGHEHGKPPRNLHQTNC